jgi:hypothetical protein
VTKVSTREVNRDPSVHDLDVRGMYENKLRNDKEPSTRRRTTTQSMLLLMEVRQRAKNLLPRLSLHQNLRSLGQLSG